MGSGASLSSADTPPRPSVRLRGFISAVPVTGGGPRSSSRGNTDEAQAPCPAVATRSGGGTCDVGLLTATRRQLLGDGGEDRGGGRQRGLLAGLPAQGQG